MKIVLKPRISLPKIHEEFFTIPPFDPDAIEKSRKQVLQQSFPRDQLATILEEYNQSLGNNESLPLIERLRSPESVCVVTGQQLGLMSGPAYTILKAISCLLLARETHAIPIFWLATEDHDIHEIDHTYLVDSLGNLKEYKLKFGNSGSFVEDLELSQKHKKEIEAFLAAVKMADFQEEIETETSYVRVVAKFLSKLFKGTGLVFLEPSLLRPLAKEFFKKEMTRSEEIETILHKTADKLSQAGLEPVLTIGETNLFFKDEQGRRKKVFRQDDLLKLIDEQPERFSTNAIARPVLQSLIIPTLAYVAGPSELYYHQQLRDYFHFHECGMPWITLRLSATIITQEWMEILEKCGVNPWNLPSRWEELFFDQADLRNTVKKLGISYMSLHLLNNAFHPHQKEQERILNWCLFQASAKSNLIQEFLEQTSLSMNQNHLYVYL